MPEDPANPAGEPAGEPPPQDSMAAGELDDLTTMKAGVDPLDNLPTINAGADPLASTIVGAQAVPSSLQSGSSEAAGDLIGPYRLIAQLGVGGFGIVWRAEQTQPIHREVALKVIKPGMDSGEIIARFEAERQALALMDHPNIAAVLDAGTTQSGRPFFAMELVKGMPITEYCDAHQLSIRQRLELFIPVCQAVQHAHQKAILHRDLKPSNILIEEVDGKPVPKVIDFGIAKALHATDEPALHATLARTLEGMFVGTPQYMSPEQAGSVPDVDTRSDIYSLGVILYELLVGDTPLSREQLKRVAVDEILRVIRESEPRRPSSRFIPITDVAKTTAAMRHTEPKKLGHALRGDLDWILLKTLEKDRTRRYETATALAKDLERHLRSEPVEAGPPTAVYLIRKLLMRHKGPVAAACIVLFCLVAGIAATSIALLKAERAANLANLSAAKSRRAAGAIFQMFKMAEDITLEAGNTVGDLVLRNLYSYRRDRDENLDQGEERLTRIVEALIESMDDAQPEELKSAPKTPRLVQRSPLPAEIEAKIVEMSKKLEQVRVTVTPNGLTNLDPKSAFHIPESSETFENTWKDYDKYTLDWNELTERLVNSRESKVPVYQDAARNKLIDYAVTWCCFDLVFLDDQLIGDGAYRLIALDREGLIKLREALKHISSRELRFWVLSRVLIFARESVLGNG